MIDRPSSCGRRANLPRSLNGEWLRSIIVLILRRGGFLAEIIINEAMIADGERCFIVYVDKPKGVGQTIVADLVTNLTGPVPADRLAPRRLSGFELPALELIHKAQELAQEAGVAKILLVDPQGLLPLAKINRYERR